MFDRAGCSKLAIAVAAGWMLVGQSGWAQPAASQPGMVMLQHADPVFREGLRRHAMLAGAGTRLHNSGMYRHVFGDTWKNAPQLAAARQSGRWYYVDRITGGMPFQSLDGIEDVAAELQADDNFLGFQVHEWGNSPIHDYERVQRLILEPGQPFDAEHFAPFEGRVQTPYFSGGDYAMYADVWRPIRDQADMEAYLERYFRKLVGRTRGQVLSVTGYGQLQHAALRLGAKHVMAEVGSQVPLTGLQIAFTRGAAREFGKPFGVYYEPWGGTPMGCYSALPFSTWFPQHPQMQEEMDGYHIGPQYGSSRSLQRRLLWYSWLAGAAFCAEEWGAESYFANWSDYPLTEYGRNVQELLQVTAAWPRPEPLVPAGLVLPPGTFGVDIRYVAGSAENLWRTVPPDACHQQLRSLSRELFQSSAAKGYREASNLTPAPWAAYFDVLSADATAELLAKYPLVVYLDPQQAATSPAAAAGRSLVYDVSPEAGTAIRQRIAAELPIQVDGLVATAQAFCGDRLLVGVFNNLGITKSVSGGEQAAAEATQTACLRGAVAQCQVILGHSWVSDIGPEQISLQVPAGEVVILSFPRGV